MSKWTEDRVELLKKLWCEGKTAKEIAGELGDGVTRNAVIGKAHRLKLSGRVSPIQANTSPKTEAAINSAKKSGKVLEAKKTGQTTPKRKITTSQKVDARPPKISRTEVSIYAEKALGTPVKMEDLKDCMCKWPVGDPQDGNFHFCGAKKGDNGTPYCDTHAAIAYNMNAKPKAIAEVDDSASSTQRDATDEMLASVANA